MGYNKDKGLSRNDRAAAKRSARREQRQNDRVAVNVEDLNCPELMYALRAIIGAGGALRVGTTRDGGAWAFGIYGDGGDPYTDYLRPAEGVAEYLADLGDYFEGVGNGGKTQETDA